MIHCPPATQNAEINTRNRIRAVREALYGPVKILRGGRVANLSARAAERYWHKIARRWGIPYSQAVLRRCRSCAAFDTSREMVACGGASPDGEVGYCRAWHFTCAARRVCLSWSPRS